MFDLETLSDVLERETRVVRVVIAETKGSTPREVGAELLVWDGGTSGTIGGGRLEWEAEARARDMLGIPHDQRSGAIGQPAVRGSGAGSNCGRTYR